MVDSNPVVPASSKKIRHKNRRQHSKHSKRHPVHRTASPPSSPPSSLPPTPSSSSSVVVGTSTRKDNIASLVWVTGILRVHARGFGFITPSRLLEVDSSTDDDIFVNSKLLKGLLDGDVVTAAVIGGETQAVKIRLVSRTRIDLVGLVVAPLRVQVDPGVGVDQFTLSTAAPVGKVVKFRVRAGTAKVIKVLGLPDVKRVAFERFLDRYQIPVDRPSGALSQTIKSVRHMSAGRRDMTSSLVVTIDDDSSQDLDDALSASLDADGSVRLWVHIADVAEHIREGSPIDKAAADMPTSVYLPQGVRHMLPDAFAADYLSLIPRANRDTLCVEMRISPEGDVQGVDIYEARICSRQRLSYGTVAKVFDGHVSGVSTDVVNLLRVLRTASVRLGILRIARGDLDSMRSQHGVPSVDDKAHQMIERLMVATNEAVALWLVDRGMPAMWRVHDPIRSSQVPELERVALGFGIVAGLGSPVSSLALACTVAQVPTGTAGAAFWDALLGVLGTARYSVVRSGHFGLGSTGYVHFTSPLRRYPDLLVHRVVKGYLAGHRRAETFLPMLARHVDIINDAFRRAAAAERAAVTSAGLSELSVGRVAQATVTGRTRTGVRVRLDALAVSGNLVGSFSTGTRVAVRVTAVDALAGVLELALVPPRRAKV